MLAQKRDDFGVAAYRGDHQGRLPSPVAQRRIGVRGQQRRCRLFVAVQRRIHQRRRFGAVQRDHEYVDRAGGFAVTLPDGW